MRNNNVRNVCTVMKKKKRGAKEKKKEVEKD